MSPADRGLFSGGRWHAARGNCIVIKPSEFTPGAVAQVVDAAAGALPAGVLQVVNGAAETARADRLAARAGHHLHRLGGHRPAGLRRRGRIAGRAVAGARWQERRRGPRHGRHPAAASAIMGAAMQCAGQRCTAVSRVIVREALREPLVRALVQLAEAHVLGDGLNAGVTMGPVTTAAQLAKIEQMVSEGLASGAVLRTGGRRVQPADAPEGRFYAPTVLDAVPRGAVVAREEIFGPVLSVMGCESLEDAIALVNEVPFGLTSSFFSNDCRAVRAFMEQARTGMLHINHGTVPDSHMPFGGIGQSGVGAYSVGASAQAFYTTEHVVYTP